MSNNSCGHVIGCLLLGRQQDWLHFTPAKNFPQISIFNFTLFTYIFVGDLEGIGELTRAFCLITATATGGASANTWGAFRYGIWLWCGLGWCRIEWSWRQYMSSDGSTWHRWRQFAFVQFFIFVSAEVGWTTVHVVRGHTRELTCPQFYLS